MTAASAADPSKIPLYAVDHDYFIEADPGYYQPGWYREFASWDDFMLEYQDAEPCWNLVVRFDMEWFDEECERMVPTDRTSEPGELRVYFLAQRKAKFWVCKIKVHRSDERRIRNWLQPRWEYLRSLWFPLDGSLPCRLVGEPQE